MSLITIKDIITAGKLQRLGLLKKPVACAVMSMTKINKVNQLYDKIKDKKGQAFFEAFIKERDLSYIVFEEDLAKIPQKGAFIIVANHPLGAIDGVLMSKIISKIRPDFKIMGNFLLEKIEPMQPYVVPVNPFEKRKDLYSSATGLKGALQHIKNGGCLGIFPAGEVSNKNNEYSEILDKKWENTIIKFIKKADVPVLPMYFHCKNSLLFYNLSKIHSDLQTLLLPSEMMKKREKPIKIRIGKSISSKMCKEYESSEELGEYLRKKVYMMKSYYEKRKSISEILNLPNLKLKYPYQKAENRISNIIDETPKKDIITDIEKIRTEGKMLFKNGNYEVYFSDYQSIPSIVREIGRQRELTFRAIGEGSNLPFDLDQYDQHYHHLFLWDEDTQELAGAYRMALGSKVMKIHGIKGFYTSSLFEFDQELQPFFRKVIEMGRAYITEKYQQKPLPLFLLWRGIAHVCLRNPEHKFLMGSVSISNKFSDFSKSLIIEFMRSHYYDSAVAQFIHPKNEFKVNINNRERDIFMSEANADLNKLDKIIDDLEPELRLPVLIKKYIKQNAKVISFNVDPNFNDAVDGLMYIRISDLPESTIKPVLEEMSEKYRKEQ